MEDWIVPLLLSGTAIMGAGLWELVSGKDRETAFTLLAIGGTLVGAAYLGLRHLA